MKQTSDTRVKADRELHRECAGSFDDIRLSDKLFTAAKFVKDAEV